MKQERQILTLLVLEKGATWPSWSSELRARAHNVIVEAQLEQEDLVSFGARMMARIEKLRERGDQVLGAGYVCSQGHARPASVEESGTLPRGTIAHGAAVGIQPVGEEATQDDVRWRVGCALIELLNTSSDAQLVVGGGDWTGSTEARRARSRVLELWARLSEVSPQHPVGVRFEEEGTSSGVYPAASRAQVDKQKTA
ncbi:MAG TPA: hypothetical protein VLC09_10855 [Polyangiaceae bacterium]|nr:hypothetical protein [Polyangiaceae bacterium]